MDICLCRNGVAPVVSLDSKKYKLVQQLDAATPSGAPSLIGCDRLTVEGDVILPGAAVFKVCILCSWRAGCRLDAGGMLFE